MRHRRYLHRRLIRFPYLIHIFYGVRKPWWPHRYSERIEKFENLRKYKHECFVQNVTSEMYSSVGKYYSDKLSSGEISKEEFEHRIAILMASAQTFDELRVFANMDWRSDMRKLNHLCVLQCSFRKMNPYIDRYDDFKEPIFQDRARLKEMLTRMQSEYYMDRRREILMEYVKDGCNYDINYVIIWKLDAERRKKKMYEFLNWNEEMETKIERLLQRAELTPRQIAIVEEGLLNLQVRKLKEEWDDLDARMKSLSTAVGRANICAKLQETIDDCTRQLQELHTGDGVLEMMKECTDQVEFLEKAIFEIEEKCEKLRK